MVNESTLETPHVRHYGNFCKRNKWAKSVFYSVEASEYLQWIALSSMKQKYPLALQTADKISSLIKYPYNIENMNDNEWKI